MSWLVTAYAKCGSTAAYVGTILWHLVGMKQNELTFQVSNVVAGDYGLTPKVKRLALKKLEKAGLVQLEKRGRKAMTVTITTEN
jgi:hypothetical protein